MKNFLFSFLVFAISFSAFAQGKIDGFYRGKANTTTVLGFGVENSKSYLAGRNEVALSRDLFYATLFGAYGITNNLDIQINVPYLESDQNKNLQDISIFAKFRFHQKRAIQLSLGIGFSAPLSNYDIGGLYDIGQQATIIETRAMAHYQCNSNWFATLQSGFSYKFDEVPNSIPFTLKIGKASKHWYFDVYYDYQYTFGGDDYLGSPRPQNFRKFGVDYHKFGSTLYKPLFKNIGLYITASYLVAGRNVFLGSTYGTGLVYNF